MNNKKSASPKLRFAEFANRGEVIFENGDALFEAISDKDHNSDLPVLAITQEQGAIPREMIDYHVFVTDRSLESYKKVEVGDFIISLRSFQGGIEYSSYQGICSPAYIILRKKENVVNEYYKHYFKSQRFIRDLNRNLEGIRDGKMVSFDQFSQILIPKPDTDEQKKIADCIESLDDLICAENNRLNAMQKHKAGLMQKFFPSNEESLPELRFKEFADIKIAFKSGYELFDSISNKDHKCNLPILAISQEHGAVPREKIDYNVFVSNKSLESYKVVEIGDFIISLRSFQGGIEYSVYRGICSPAYIILRKKIDICDQYFKYYFKTKKFIADLNKNLEGIRDGKMVSYSQFSELALPVPDKKEQQKIADCLCSVDELINTQATKIEELRNHKNGLLQKLFPSFEEVIK